MVDLIDPTASFSNAFNAAQGVTDTFRKNMAFKALEKTYGPIVGDMKLATDVQAYQQNELMNPLRVENQQLQNTSLQQSNAFNAANNPLVIESNQIGNETARFNQDQAVETAEREEKLRSAQQMHATLAGVLSTVETELDGIMDPNERLAVFDRNVQQLAPLIGADPETLLHSLAQQRAAIAAQGAGAIAPIRQQLDDLLYGQLSPEEKQKLQQGTAQLALTQAQTEKAVADADVAKAKAAAEEAEKQNEVKVARRTLDDFKLKKKVATDAIDRAIKIAKDFPTATGPSSAVEINGAKLAPGAADLAAELNTLQSHIGLDELRKLKESGATLGQVTMGEHTLLQGALGALAQTQSRDMFIANLKRIKELLKATEERTEEAFSEDFTEITVNGGNGDETVVDAADYFGSD